MVKEEKAHTKTAPVYAVKIFRKIRMIFDIENSLWKSEIGIFCHLILESW